MIIPLDTSRPPDEIAQWLRDTKATHLAVTSDLLAKARDLLQGAHIQIPIIEIEKKQGGEYDTVSPLRPRTSRFRRVPS